MTNWSQKHYAMEYKIINYAFLQLWKAFNVYIDTLTNSQWMTS